MTAPTPLLNGIPAPGNSFVLWDQKMVYMSVTKVACTSLRWMVADLSGENLERFYSAIGPQQTRLMTIHVPREEWECTPQLLSLTAEQLEEISVDNGWFIFAVVRDPWSRLWSAWQSKFLVRHAFYYDNYGDEAWFPSIPSSQEQVVADFRAFLDAKPWTTDQWLSEDVHFLPQTFSVRPQGVNYSRIYDLAQIDELFRDVTKHLEQVGRPVEELYVPRANETPLPLIPAVLADGVADQVLEIYASDFEAFGDRWNLDDVFRHGDSWTPDALRHAAYHTVANERIGDLRREGRRFRRQAERANARAQRLEAEVTALREAQARRPTALANRAARRVGRDVSGWLRARRDAR